MFDLKWLKYSDGKILATQFPLFFLMVGIILSNFR